MSKTNLAIFFGGRSCEHEISIITAQQAMAGADRGKYELFPVYIAPDGKWRYGSAFSELKIFAGGEAAKMGAEVFLTPNSRILYTRVRKKMRPIAEIGAAMLCMHGLNGEDGTLQGLLELSGVPYTSCGVTASGVCMDKIVSKYMFKGLGIDTVDFTWLTAEELRRSPETCIGNIEKAVGYPCVVKPANLGSSIGISVCKDGAALKDALAVAASFDRRILVERALTNFFELNCSVLGIEDEAAASECEKPASWHEFLTFEDKYLGGGKEVQKREKEKVKGKGDNAIGNDEIKARENANAGAKMGMASLKRELPAKIAPAVRDKVRAASIAVFKALNCKGVIRADFMVDFPTGIVYINEVNTIPGSLSFYLWEQQGLKFGQLIDKLAGIAVRGRQLQDALNYAYKTDVISGAAKSAKLNK